MIDIVAPKVADSPSADSPEQARADQRGNPPIRRKADMKLWRLEAVRGAAAVYVMVSHFISPPPLLLSFGQEAVMVFFLLSGFVIEYSSRKSLSSGFRPYFLKRFVRIYSVVICLFVVAALLEKSNVESGSFWTALTGNLLMLQDFNFAKPNVIVPTLFASALWSLHYEWWFYMFYFPAATRIKPAYQTAVLGGLGILAAASYWLYPNVLNRLLFYFPIWWAGVVMARSYIRNQRVALRDMVEPCSYLMGIALILFAECAVHLMRGGRFTPGIHPFLELRHILAGLLAIGVALLWQHGRWFGFRQALGWGIWVAPISFALYVAHQPLLTDAHYLGRNLNPIIRGSIYFFGLIVFCYATERVFYPWLRKITKK